MAEELHARTGGHPRLLVQVCKFVARNGRGDHAVAAISDQIPPLLRDLIELRLSQLSLVQQLVLEGASVAGTMFSTAAVPACTTMATDPVELQLEQLCRHGHFIEACGLSVWPDGTTSGRYRFSHAFHEQMLRTPCGKPPCAHEAGCTAPITRSVVRWYLGYPDEALRLAHDACLRSDNVGNPYSPCIIRPATLGNVLIVRRDWQAVLVASDDWIARGQKFSHRDGLLWSQRQRGIALAMLGGGAEGLPMLMEALAEHQRIGNWIGTPIDNVHAADPAATRRNQPWPSARQPLRTVLGRLRHRRPADGPPPA